VAPLCCPRCRLLQRGRGRSCLDCGERTTTLDGLIRDRIAGLTTASRPPASGLRDALALHATAFGALGATAAAVLITGSALGALVLPVAVLLGYKKQFWKTVLRRRPRLAAVSPRPRPTGAPLVGVARPFERTVTGGALAIATTIENSQGVIVRAMDAAPFWLVLADRRVLVTGDCWVAGAASASLVPESQLLREIDLGDLPLARAIRSNLRVTRTVVAPGDRVAVHGRLRDEQLPGAGGYRDSLTETLRGEPGALVWIERLDEPARAAPDLASDRAPPP
jgi:hypothetical protein